MPYERQRLNGQGMTPEERALRKQWLLDQNLKPHEPPNSVEALETKYFLNGWRNLIILTLKQ
jgi:hypothetical protein